jgi:hypothetical protein
MQVASPVSEGAVKDAKFNRITKYHNDRDRADKDTTSRLRCVIGASLFETLAKYPQVHTSRLASSLFAK